MKAIKLFKNHPFLRAIYIFILCWIGLISLLSILYLLWLRDWQMNWGANDEEIKRYMIGDELLVEPEFNTTRVVEINAPPEKVWPWIVQMGMGRGGFYNFDMLDNAGKPSADSIIPEYQDLKVGDLILGLLQVQEIKPNTSILWRFLEGAGGWENATWSWGLYETKNHNTRLVSRLRQKYNSDSLLELCMYGFQEIFEIFMMRTSLLGIKHRVEEYNKD
ncbi:MAG: hypothetical protein ACW990_09605 [Promethearchaeota archaeon]|jgi:hypothetical protein